MRARVITWVGVAVSVAVLTYLAVQFDLENTAEAMQVANLSWLLPAAALYLALFPLRGLRWRGLMRGVADVPVRTATEVFMVGAMANNVLPARLGDVARAFVLSRQVGIPATTTFSNVVLERILDGLTVVGLLTVVLVTSPPEAPWVRSVGATMALLFVAATILCCLIAWNQQATLQLTAKLLSPLPKPLAEALHGLIGTLTRGIDVLKNPAEMARVLLLSGLVWGLEVGVYALVQQAFGLQIPLPGLVLTMAVLTLGMTAPSAPGFVGVFEGLIVAAVTLYGVQADVALAFAITVHLVHFVPVTLLGLLYAWRNGLKIRDLNYAAAEGEPATGGV